MQGRGVSKGPDPKVSPGPVKPSAAAPPSPRRAVEARDLTQPCVHRPSAVRAWGRGRGSLARPPLRRPLPAQESASPEQAAVTTTVPRALLTDTC